MTKITCMATYLYAHYDDAGLLIGLCQLECETDADAVRNIGALCLGGDTEVYRARALGRFTAEESEHL